MFKKIKEVFGKTGDVIRQYPVVLLMAFLGAVAFMCFAEFNYNSNSNYFVFLKFGLVACLGISIMFALKMLSQRSGRQILFEILGVIFLVFFYFLLPEREQDFTEKYAFLLIPTFILSHLLVSFFPFLGRNREMQFWQYNKNLFINIVLTAIFTGVLTGGVELAVLAVDRLFEFKFNERLYVEIFYLMAIFGSSLIFLLFNSEGLKNLEKDETYPVILKFFTQYILIPLLIIYAVILYFYAIKILVKWQLPRGWVSYLVLAYSIVGILALLLVHPLKNKNSMSWVRLFSQIFYFSLTPLLVLLFTAIFTRILEYGYTEPRYFVLLLAGWISTVVLYFIFAKNSTIKFVPISLFIFGLFALTFPYLNTFSVAKRSQKSELQKILAANNLLKAGKIDFSKKISDTLANEVSDKLEFLALRDEENLVMSLLPEKVKSVIATNLKKGNIYQVRSELRSSFKNVQYSNFGKNKDLINPIITLTSRETSLDISGYTHLFKAENYRKNTFKFNNNTLIVNLPARVHTSAFSITFNGQKTDLTPDFKKLFENYPTNGEIKVDELSITKQIGANKIKFIFDFVTRTKNAEGNEIYFVNSPAILIVVK